MRRSLVPFVLALLGACTDPEPQKPESDEDRRARLEARVDNNGGKDPWAFYELGELDESRGDLEKAARNYGAAISLLPPRKFTRPATSYGRVMLRRNQLDAARRLFEEVVHTVPMDPSLYKENPDFKEAALGLKDIYEKQNEPRLAERMKQRFLDEFGGAPAEWP